METFQLEYVIKSSPNILFYFVSTLDGLSQWFADDVKLDKKDYVFKWKGAQETALIVSRKTNEHIRFKWKESGDDQYFEFKIERGEITGDTILIITDFAASDKEKEEKKQLWDKQVDDLSQLIGARG